VHHFADPDPAACTDTVMTLLQALCQAKEDFTLIIDGERNENLSSFAGSQHNEDLQSFAGSQHSENLSLFADLVKTAGTLCRRQEAGMYALFEE